MIKKRIRGGLKHHYSNLELYFRPHFGYFFNQGKDLRKNETDFDRLIRQMLVEQASGAEGGHPKITG